MSDQVKQKPKGTKVTETIIGAASNKMMTATKALNDAAANALKLTATLDENALKIADQEDRLAGLQLEYQNRRAQNHIDLDLAYKADQKQFADLYLASNSLVAVDKNEYLSLEQEVQDLKRNFTDKVKSEVTKAEAIAENRLKNEKALFEAQYQAKEAQNIAQIKTLEQQLAFATKQAETWEKQLNAERAASIERAKGQTATVNVTGQNGR